MVVVVMGQPAVEMAMAARPVIAMMVERVVFFGIRFLGSEQEQVLAGQHQGRPRGS